MFMIPPVASCRAHMSLFHDRLKPLVERDWEEMSIGSVFPFLPALLSLQIMGMFVAFRLFFRPMMASPFLCNLHWTRLLADVELIAK